MLRWMTLSPLTSRRVRDAVAGPSTPYGETEDELLEEIERLSDAIRAAQSTDDLGPAMNREIAASERSCWARLDDAKRRLAELRAAPPPPPDDGARTFVRDGVLVYRFGHAAD